MADISMCANATCPLRHTCFRQTAKPNPYRQSYSQYEWREEDGEAKCDSYWEDKRQTIAKIEKR